MSQTSALISINDAAARGTDRVRMPRWANQFDHIKIVILDGTVGPWANLFAPFNVKCNGHDPQELRLTEADCNECVYVPYDGALPGSDEYRAAQAVYNP